MTGSRNTSTTSTTGARATNSPLFTKLGFLALIVALAAAMWALRPAPEALLVYCAHDAEFSDAILQKFRQETGIPVVVRYDTEAQKSLGLVNALKSERDNPRCDVFWNNELLGTVDLHQAGLLEPYQGPGHGRILPNYKDPAGHWTGFAARLRVFIVNPEKQPADEALIQGRLATDSDLSRAAIAQPMFGTTLTHYTVLWHEWGGERLKEWHRSLRSRGIREVPGNGATKRLVAEGACDFGFTDTDDYFGARDDGKAVDMTPVRVDRRTICIPNTVSIIRGTKRTEAARKLVDFLLSEETELALARSASRQVPLGRVDEGRLPDEVAALAEFAREGFDLRPLLPDRKAVLDWLASEAAP